MIYNINVITNNKFSMKKNRLTLVAAIFLSGTILFSSCVGSFGLFNRISSWNQSIGTKFVNELVFLALILFRYMALLIWQTLWLSILLSSGVAPTRWLM